MYLVAFIHASPDTDLLSLFHSFLYGCRISISHAHSRPLLSLSHSLFPLVVLVLVLPLQTPERADICARTRCDRYLGDRHGFGMYFYAEHPDEPHQEYVGQV